MPGQNRTLGTVVYTHVTSITASISTVMLNGSEPIPDMRPSAGRCYRLLIAPAFCLTLAIDFDPIQLDRIRGHAVGLVLLETETQRVTVDTAGSAKLTWKY
jgi:hypothetical protein